MDLSFWNEKWEKGETAFHEGEANELLTKYFDKLNLEQGSRVFIPLCGKTRDISWLLLNGYQVVGAELSEIAVQQLFSDLGIEPEITSVGELEHYQASNVDIFVGDIFDLTADMVGSIDAIYDRAALVALPSGMRKRYTEHLIKITGTAAQLLICFVYDQSVMAGPPFSIITDEVLGHYEAHYRATHLESKNVQGGLKGIVDASEVVWLLI